MTEFFEDKGTWAGLPVSVQGIFEDGECIAVKVLDRTAHPPTPISWTFPPLGDPTAGKNGRVGDLRKGFMNIIQRLYNERNAKEVSKPNHNRTPKPTIR